jgi:[acyl-carrier-protein] S-malonyltransferase
VSLDHVAFVFPGQGAQSVGMGNGLVEAFPTARALFAEADEVLGFPLSRIIREGPEEELRRTANTQPALLLVSLAAFRALDLRPSFVAGHSLGEYSALVAAGALSFRDAIALVHKRGRYMQEAVPSGEGAMFALIGVDLESVERAVAAATGPVDVANLNAPDQIVLAGARAATRRAAEDTGARKIVELAVSAPFHCRLMKPAEERLAADLDRVAFADPEIPLYTNVDAEKVTTAAGARDALKRQVTRPVRWTESVARMISAEGVHTFVEVGPGSVLSGLIRRIDRNVRRFSVHDRASVESVRNELSG